MLFVVGAQMFSPGPLTAAHPQHRPLQGFTHHADFENECGRCHQPLLGPAAERCLACHTSIADEMKAPTELHAALREADNCVACHPDHLGRAARITRINAHNFPHQEATAFSLVQHSLDYDGLSIECADCHPSDSYDFEPVVCVVCHASAEPTFMTKHQANFGNDCLACHDGNTSLDIFDHAAFFPLEGAHATVGCVDCHANHQFTNTPRDCYSCHRNDDAHQGQLGTECSLCHTPTTWSQAALENHTFPITHENEDQPIECQVCHPATYMAYTCYGCHEHNPTKIERKHLGEGIRDFQNCTRCHPTGHKGEDINEGVEEDDHDVGDDE